MKRSYAAALIFSVLAVGAFVFYQTTAGVTALRPFPARIAIVPKQAAVFRGDALQFAATVVGAAGAYTVHWTMVGPGAIDDQGLYQSPDDIAVANVVASAGAGLTDSATVQTVAPPPKRIPLALVSCYDNATIDVHDRGYLQALGSLSLQGRTAGVAFDPRRRLAFVAADSELYAIDLNSMRWKASPPVPGARFSEAAYLRDGLIAVSDNNATDGQPGIRLFRADAAGVPLLVRSAAAGETPEGIAVGDAGRTMYVSNINSNSIMRFALQPDGGLRRTGFARTGTRPFGIALDPRHHLLFVADNDTSTVSGARALPGLERFALPSLHRIGSVISTGSHNSLPLGLSVDSALSRLFVVNEGDSNVVVYALPSMRRVTALAAGLTPWLPSLDARHHRLFVPNARANTFDVYDTQALATVRRDVPTCAYPTFIGLSSD